MIPAGGNTAETAVKNSIYGLSTWMIPLALNVIAVPLIVRSLGNGDYGLYALVLGVIGHSFNLNFGRAITKYVAEYRATGREEEIGQIMSASLWLNLLAGGTGVVVLAVFARKIVAYAFTVGPESAEKLTNGIYLAAAIILLAMVNQIFNSILHGLKRFDLYSKIYNLRSFALVTGNVALALYGYGLIALLTWNLIVIAATSVLNGIICRTLLPDVRWGLWPSGSHLRLVLLFSGAIIGYQILSNLLLLFERGWIVRIFGAEELTFYVVPMLLAIYFYEFIASLMMVVFPMASEFGGDPMRLKKLYRQATKAALFFSVLAMASVLVLGRHFLTIWMGIPFASQSAAVLSIQMITFSLMAVQVVMWHVTEGLGRPEYNLLFIVFLVAVSLAFMIPLSGPYGIEGVALGRLAGAVVLFLSIFLMEWRFFGRIEFGFWGRFLGLFAFAGAVAGASEYGMLRIAGTGWAGFGLASIAGVLIYVMIAILTGCFDSEERRLVKGLISRLNPGS